MSCHVTRVGIRPLQLLATNSRSSITPPTTLLLAAISTRPYLSAQASRVIPRLLKSSIGRIQQDVAATNTKSAGFGHLPSTTAQIGLRRFSLPRIPNAGDLSGRRSTRWLLQKRPFSDKRNLEHGREAKDAPKASEEETSSTNASKTAPDHGDESKTILDRLPHLHRPTKYELLAAATSFWERVRIHFKWISIRSLRPFTMDEIGAFVSWIFLGHLVWIVIGTTTFVSLAIWAVNTVFAQETLAGWVGNYLTKSSGIKIVFESAIVPAWSNGVITFNNVFVSRRPGQSNKKRSVEKGSSITAAAAAEAAMAEKARENSDPDDDGNYSQFDVAIDTVNVTLSFSKWFNGKGLLRDVDIRGVRGVIDRTSVKPAQGYIDPKTLRHEHNTGDFEIDEFKMSDVLLTVHQPNNFRPFTVSVFNCDLPRLRKQWLFYDFMSANNMNGSFDDSLFAVHPRQVHGHTGAQLTDGSPDIGEHSHWKKHSRLRIDGLNIDHLNRGVEGTFAWIREGNVDIVADVMLPNDEDGVWLQSWRKSTEAMSELYDRVGASVTSAQTQGKIPQAGDVVQNAPDNQTPQQQDPNSPTARFVVMDIKVNLNDVRASVPLFTKDLSYVNNALVRPIVAYINSRRAFIPVNCRVVKRQSEFDGSWTVFDSGLMQDLSRETYDAFARDIEDVDARKRRIKKVGLWTIQLAAQALFIGLAGQLA